MEVLAPDQLLPSSLTLALLAIWPDMDAIMTMLPAVFCSTKMRAQCLAGINVPRTLNKTVVGIWFKEVADCEKKLTSHPTSFGSSQWDIQEPVPIA